MIFVFAQNDEDGYFGTAFPERLLYIKERFSGSVCISSMS